MMKIKSLDSNRYLRLETIDLWGEKALLLTNKCSQQETSIPLDLKGIDKLIYYLQKEKERILK